MEEKEEEEERRTRKGRKSVLHTHKFHPAGSRSRCLHGKPKLERKRAALPVHNAQRILKRADSG